MEEIMRAIGAHLQELGFTVDANRDDIDLPFTLEISKEGLHKKPATVWGTRNPKTLVLAEIDDQPGFLEVCTHHQDLNNLDIIELANPNSVNEIVQILNDYLVEDNNKSDC